MKLVILVLWDLMRRQIDILVGGFHLQKHLILALEAERRKEGYKRATVYILIT